MTTVIPIIVPTQRNCIVQDGVKYCEQSQADPGTVLQGVGIVIVLCLLWITGLHWVLNTFVNEGLALFSYIMGTAVTIFIFGLLL